MTSTSIPHPLARLRTLNWHFSTLHGFHYSHCYATWHGLECSSYFLAMMAAWGWNLWYNHICVLWHGAVHDPPSYFILSQPWCCRDVTPRVYTAALVCSVQRSMCTSPWQHRLWIIPVTCHKLSKQVKKIKLHLTHAMRSQVVLIVVLGVLERNLSYSC